MEDPGGSPIGDNTPSGDNHHPQEPVDQADPTGSGAHAPGPGGQHTRATGQDAPCGSAGEDPQTSGGTGTPQSGRKDACGGNAEGRETPVRDDAAQANGQHQPEETGGAAPHSSPESEEIPSRPTEAQTRYREALPTGHTTIHTSGEGALCGFRAVINTIRAMHPGIKAPSVRNLQNTFQSLEFVEHTAAFGLNDQDTFFVGQVGAVLHFWGQTYQDKNLQLGYILNDVPYLVPHPNQDHTTVVWIAHDGDNHYEGVRPKKPPQTQSGNPHVFGSDRAEAGGPETPDDDSDPDTSTSVGDDTEIEPAVGLKRTMTAIFRRPGEAWSLYKAVKFIILQLRIVRTFSNNRKAYQHICVVCKTLELHQNKFVISPFSSDRREQAYRSLVSVDRSHHSAAGPSGSGSKTYTLGNLGDIKQRAESCPFCKLVVHSLEDLKLNAKYEENIKKCGDNKKKYHDDIKRFRAEIRKCEAEIDRLYNEQEAQQGHQDHQDHQDHEEHTATSSDSRLQNEAKTEKFIATLKPHREIINKRMDDIRKCQDDIAESTRATIKYESEKRRSRRQINRAICHASFQMDGREVERDASGTVIDSRPRTRRVQLRWSNPHLETSYIVLVAPEPGRGYDTDQRHMWESNTLFLARSIRSANKNHALIKSWMDLCRCHHGKPCNTEPGDDFQRLISKAFFGVIDVAEMRLTSLPPGSRYVALSYTWGQQTLYTTNLSNIQLHQEYGGLEKQFAYLPKVIQDTIQLVRSLGERYLWIDSLCIVQQSDISWSLNSSVMDLVYGNAYVTICAAEGEGAQTGLRGLDPKRTVSQNIEECAEGLRLTVSHLAETYIGKSRWNTRGWTFQERLLSRRCVLFVGERVFFQCRSTALSEDIIGEQETAGWSIELVQAPLQMLVDIGSKAFSVYTECVRLYSKRDLGQRRDILAAFRGMSNLISKEMAAPLHFGLPTSHFDLALLWSPTSSCRRRIARDEKERKAFGDMKFPSWSWCGWSDSAIEYRSEVMGGCLANVNQWLTEHTWIRWYVRDGEGDLRPIWDRSQVRRGNDETTIGTRWLGYGYTPNLQCDDYGRVVHQDYLQHDSKPLETSKFKRTLLEYPFGISEVKGSTEATRAYPDQPYLQFWTWSAHLRVTQRDGSQLSNLQAPGEGLVRCDIEDCCGDWCGTIVLNKEWFEEWYHNHQEEKSVHEFIAISEAKNFSQEESDMWTYYVPREREQAEWHLFYVLLVSRRGAIYQREGLGKVFKTAFAKSYLPGKEWKEFVMG